MNMLFNQLAVSKYRALFSSQISVFVFFEIIFPEPGEEHMRFQAS